MSHTVTGKLNNDANEHPNQSGVTFFVRLGEKNYNFKTKEAEWTNYEAAVFVKENQAQFYRDALVAGAIVTIGGKGLIVENDPQYGVKLHVQDARIEYAFNPNSVHLRQAPRAAGAAVSRLSAASAATTGLSSKRASATNRHHKPKASTAILAPSSAEHISACYGSANSILIELIFIY